MSVYGRMEEGAVDGYRDKPTGPVTIYRRGNVSGRASRALNRTEKEKKLEELLGIYGTRMNRVHEQMAAKYLQFMRQMLRGFKLHNHLVWLSCKMGMVSLMVTNRKLETVFVSDMRSRAPVVARLQEIDQWLEGSWEWAYYLDETAITDSPKVTK